MAVIDTLKKELRRYATPTRAQSSRRFFKTGTGEYGEGDVFIGITVPDVRRVAKKFADADMTVIAVLLASPIHEERSCALELLVYQYEQGDERAQARIAKWYLKHLRGVNNWDLVDGSAPYILGHWLRDKDRAVLYKLARSKNIWERRIAIVTTYHFIQHNDVADTLKIAELLLNDTHDLIHKAVGWMLREVGKCDRRAEEAFLKKHYKTMPRTMLRYAIERFPQKRRLGYLRVKTR